MAKKEIKMVPEVKETESGILVATTKVAVKQPYFVKEGGKDIYIVVDQNGNEARVYDKRDGIDNPKAAAESYAKKLSSQFN